VQKESKPTCRHCNDIALYRIYDICNFKIESYFFIGDIY